MVVFGLLHEDFGNGRDYYHYHGRRLAVVSDRRSPRPARQYRDWHHENVFLGEGRAQHQSSQPMALVRRIGDCARLHPTDNPMRLYVQNSIVGVRALMEGPCQGTSP